jgi:hypothetical protein
MMSLLDSWKTGGGAFVPGSLLKTIGDDVLPAVGRLVGTFTDSRSRMAAIGTQDKVNDISAARTQIDIFKKRERALDTAMGEYGRSLVAGARAGGVMPSYYGHIWKGLADDVEDENEDYRAIQFRHSVERANFAAQRATVRMQFIERLTDGIFGNGLFGGGHWPPNGGRRFPR